MRLLIPLLPLLALAGCQAEEAPFVSPAPSALDAAYLHGWHDALTDVLVTDIVSPPVASRMYVYPHVAAYEALAALDPAYRSLAGQLVGLEAAPAPEVPVHAELASSVAFVRMAERLVFDPTPLQQRLEGAQSAFQSSLPRTVYEASVEYGEAVAAAVLDYARADNYAQTRSMPQYTVMSDDPGRWQPTPPDYMAGLEPSWHHVRPFALARADEFAPAPPTPYDTTRGSRFMEETMEVYEAVKYATPEQEAIARFWDCNPLVSSHDGHLVSFSKKITPGGHWMGIAGIAARKAGLDAMRTAEAYTLTAVALIDGFVSCWDEKYRSCLVRPVTVINRHIDPDWRPILQTPSFPEYTSGHSVVSGAASTVLTHLFGEPFAFDDSTEVPFGLPVRSYGSFREAAEEAAISRLYGGIHFRPAIENGVAQGRAIGQRVVGALQTRERPALAAASGRE